jgi:hypothetical protein
MKKWLYILIIGLALIVLPTFTPEDLVTTVVLIKFLGITGYIMLALAVLLLVLIALPKRYRKKVLGS